MPGEIDKLRNLIALNKLDRALQLIKDNITAYPHLQSQLLTLLAKYNDLHQKKIIGLLDESESMKLHSQLNFSALELINEMEKGEPFSDTQATIQIQNNQSKRTVFIS